MTKDSLIYSQLEAEAKSENTSGDRLWELAQKDNHLALIVAQNTVASEKVLKELSESNNLAIRKAVCANPNTAIDILCELAIEFPQEFLENPILDCLFLENSDFLHNIPTDVFNQLFKQKGYTEYLQQLASNSKQWQVRSAVAENLHTSIDILQKLAADPHQGVRLAVARNPNASIDALKQLAANFNPGVRRTVARNPNVSRDILEILAADPHQDVRSVVANNLKYQAKKLKSN